MLESNITLDEIKLYCDTNIPRHHVYQSNYNDCSAKYRIDYCKTKNVGRIESFGEHNHNLMDKYDNQNGIHDDIKKAIETILSHNPTLYPKKIQVVN
jgi:hypothetical protein